MLRHPQGRGKWLVIILIGAMLSLPYLSWSQSPVTDQVAVTESQGIILGIHQGEGIARVPLAAGETIITKQAKGITGFVQTSLRLLGYSGRLQRWSPQEFDVSERMLETFVSPRLILVVSERRLYGFQTEIGRWKVQDLRPRDSMQQIIVKDHVAVLVGSDRVFGFSAFTGGFFLKDLPLSEEITNIQANDNIVILQFQEKQLIFRSGLALWAEIR
ncbi:MAG: hypothetical protein MRJ96_12500 [Nitrospirales bacterium]|nr:hypothetical protein [Nitrospira sp.]MDR4502263.1 hypothetical protein [Nitrospirales bacterium]